MSNESLVAKAKTLAEVMHHGQVDKAGKPYIEHLATVAGAWGESGTDDYTKAVAWLHDIIEDTYVTEDDLRKAGFPEEVVQTVVELTRKEGESYRDFIERIAHSGNERAIKIKKADLVHNMDLFRIANPTDEDRERIEVKYKPAYLYLSKGKWEEKPMVNISNGKHGDECTQCPTCGKRSWEIFLCDCGHVFCKYCGVRDQEDDSDSLSLECNKCGKPIVIVSL